MRPIVLTLALLAIVAASPSRAASPAPGPSDGPSRTFDARDVFGLQVADDPQIRPDGAQVAYVRRAYDIMTDKAARSLWLIDVARGSQSPIVEGPGAGTPRWSPDGGRIAYVAQTGEGPPQLHVRWMAAGATA